MGARLAHRDDGAWSVQLGRRPQIDPDGHGLGLRHSGLFIGGWSWRAGNGRCAGLCVMTTDFRGPLLYAYHLGPAGRSVLPRNDKQISVRILSGFAHLSLMSLSFGP